MKRRCYYAILAIMASFGTKKKKKNVSNINRC